MPSSEETKRIGLEFVDRVLNQHDIGYLKDALSEAFVDHSPPPRTTGDKAGTIESFEDIFQSFPDHRAEVVQAIASGNRVAIHTRATGTDKGGFMPGMQPTDKSVTMEGIDIVEIDTEGKHVAHWGIRDIMGAMGQLGLLPPPPSA